MHGNIAEIHNGGDILLLGRLGALADVPYNMRRPERAAVLLRRVMRNADTMRHIRETWARWTSQPSPWSIQDEEIYQLIYQDLERGKIVGVPLPHVWMSYTTGKAAAMQRAARATTSSQQSARAGQIVGASGAPTAAHLSSASQGQVGGSSPVGQWSVADRLKALIQKTIQSVHPHVGQTLVGLLSDDSLEALQVTLGVVSARNVTGFSWASDVVLACIAFGFGGVDGLEAIDDVAEALRRTARAQMDMDLNEAARMLKRAADDLTALGLMAVIYKIGSRLGTGSQGTENSYADPTYGPPGSISRTTSTPSEARSSSRSSSSAASSAPARSSASGNAPQPTPASSSAATPNGSAAAAELAKAQAATLKAAAASGVPFCEECAKRSAA